MMLTNAFHLYNKYSENKMPFFDFRLAVVKRLLSPMSKQITTKSRRIVHILKKRQFAPGKKQVPRKTCKSCMERYKKRTDTTYECETCPCNPRYCLNCSIITHK